MFIFRLNKIKIFDNRENKRFLGLFGRDRAEVRVLSFVTTDFTNLPVLDGLTRTVDEAQQKAIMEKAVASVVGSRILTTVENVRDNQTLTFGDTGFSVFFSDKIPDNFDWQLAVIESDQDIRDDAAWVSDIVAHEDFGKLTKHIGSLITAVPNPAYTAAVLIGKFALEIAIKSGKKNKDDQLGLLYMSLNRKQHYPFGKRDVQDVDDLTGNIKVDYSIFGINDVRVKTESTSTAETPAKGKKTPKKKDAPKVTKPNT
jgi:hypothetical protein